MDKSKGSYFSLFSVSTIVSSHKGVVASLLVFCSHTYYNITMKDETATRETPHLKRRGSAKKVFPDAKRPRNRKSPPSSDKAPTSTTTVPMQWEAQVSRLDPNDPVQAKRIQQRRKTILKGKNTAGYDRYLQQVPKHTRIPRNMKTPSTPDPTVDTSNKRWLGQVRAW